jgi:hypothetical protein
VTKADLISNCTTAYTGEVSYGGWWGSGSGGSETWTKEQAEAYCKKAWNKTVWYDAFWLVAAVFFAVRAPSLTSLSPRDWASRSLSRLCLCLCFGFSPSQSFATMFSFAFSRQLANPNAFLANSSTVNSHNPMHNRNPSSTAVPLQPYPSQNAPDYVPPYRTRLPLPSPLVLTHIFQPARPAELGPSGRLFSLRFFFSAGPPPSSSPHAPSSDTKAGYVPHTAEDEAWNRSLQDSERREWEQHRLNQQDHDADDHGVFVGRSGGGGGMRSHEEEEAAWEEARRTASTAGGSLNNPFRSRQESEAEDERKGGVV